MGSKMENLHFEMHLEDASPHRIYAHQEDISLDSLSPAISEANWHLLAHEVNDDDLSGFTSLLASVTSGWSTNLPSGFVHAIYVLWRACQVH